MESLPLGWAGKKASLTIKLMTARRLKMSPLPWYWHYMKSPRLGTPSLTHQATAVRPYVRPRPRPHQNKLMTGHAAWAGGSLGIR